MRSIWKGSISFGLVTIPVKLYSATEQKDVSFHQVRRSDGSRIKYKRVAATDGEEVAYGEIAKGYELSSGETVILTDDDFKDLPLTTSRAIDVLQFVPLEQVDPIFFEKSYYLEPDKAGTKPYVLLRDALDESGKVALVKVALRNRESLGTLRVRDGVFVLETMLWPDEVRAPDFDFLDEDVEVRSQELAMAGSLIETLSGDFDPSGYKDDYREALQQVIDAKVAGHEVVHTEAAQPTSGTVVDLMAALRASVAAAKKGRPEQAGDDSDAASAPAAADAVAAQEDAAVEDDEAAPARRSGRTTSKGATAKGESPRGGTSKAAAAGAAKAPAKSAAKRAAPAKAAVSGPAPAKREGRSGAAAGAAGSGAPKAARTTSRTAAARSQESSTRTTRARKSA